MFGLGGVLGGVGSVISGLDGAGGLDGVGGLDLTSKAESEAVSGGTFSSGDIAIGKSDALVIGAVVVLGLLILFWRKK